MMGTTHRTGSIALACGIVALCPADKLTIAPAATFLVASAVGGLLPDADTPYSRYGRKFFIFIWPVYLLQKLVSLLGYIVKPLKNMSKALGHRGLLHSPTLWTILLGILSLALYFSGVYDYMPYALIFGLYTGIISHVLLDFISGGVPMLAPFSLKRAHSPINFKTGSIFEWVFNIAFVGIAVACVIYGIIPKLIL